MEIAAGVASIIATCFKVAKAIHSLYGVYSAADILITAIHSESILIATSLTQLQNFILRDSDAVEKHLTDSAEVRMAFDAALQGCLVVFSCLEKEVKKLNRGKETGDPLSWRSRISYVWKEGDMKELLQAIRGQQAAVSVVASLLQLESQKETEEILMKSKAALSEVVKRVHSLRAANPRISQRIPESLFPSQSSSLDSASVIGDEQFDFDDVVVNSQAYRRVLVAAQEQGRNRGSSSAHISRDQGLTWYGTYMIDADIATARVKVLNELSKLYSEGSDLPVEARAPESSRIEQTFLEGYPVKLNKVNASGLRIGLLLMHGTHMPQVVHQEQEDLYGSRLPSQDTAEWRLRTAATLLRTHEIITASELRTTYRGSRKVQSLQSNEQAQSVEKVGDVGRHHHNPSVIELIDSDNVKLVRSSDFDEEPSFDIKCTLVELHHSKTIDFIVRYRLLQTLTAQHSSTIKAEHLDKAFESVLALFWTSPVLRRAQLRRVVGTSSYIRYGTNTGRMFQTIITSREISKVVIISARSYNSLDGVGTAALRVKYLQALTILLSLVSDQDLDYLRNFSHISFPISMDRQDIELLCLKAMPLFSINSGSFSNQYVRYLAKVFVGSDLASHPDGRHWTAESSTGIIQCEESYAWDRVLEAIVAKGCLVPSNLQFLGRSSLSWIPKWPQHGFRSSSILGHMQYCERLGKVNDIQRLLWTLLVETREPRDQSLTVTLTTGEKFDAKSLDTEYIESWITGSYSIEKPQGADGSSVCLLHIKKQEISLPIDNAVARVTKLINDMNRSLTLDKQLQRLNITNRVPWTQISALPPESLKIFKKLATKDDCTLAIAYFIAGRRVSSRDVVWAMRRYISRVQELSKQCRNVETAIETTPQRAGMISTDLEAVDDLLEEATSVCGNITPEDDMYPSPFASVFWDISIGLPTPEAWYEYNAYHAPNSSTLEVRAVRSIVTSADWSADGSVTIKLRDIPSIFNLSRLEKACGIPHDDEIRAGDRVLLLGYYAAVVEPDEDQERDGQFWYMTNYLRIVETRDVVGECLEAQNDWWVRLKATTKLL